MLIKILIAWLVIFNGFFISSGKAEQLTIAVAANFTAPMKIIAPLYQQKTGVKILSSFGGTGMLYALIKNGAPFDIFLAADQRRPALLYKEHLADKPRIYARGRAVLWTAKLNTSSATTWQEALRLPGMNRVAIANPSLAPYGATVMAAMTPAVMATITNRLVYAQNVSQAFQYAQSATDCGFTSLSFALSKLGRRGRFWPIKEASPVKQSACIIRNIHQKAAAVNFLTFLLSPEGKAILKKFGYK